MLSIVKVSDRDVLKDAMSTRYNQLGIETVREVPVLYGANLGVETVSPIQMLYGFGATEEELDDIAKRLRAKEDALSAADIASTMRVLPVADRQRLAEKLLAMGVDPTLVDQGKRDAALPFCDTTKWKKFAPVWGLLSTVSMAASAYHGYKRNESVGWALWWGLMGALFPVISPSIALAQGFGKPKK